MPLTDILFGADRSSVPAAVSEVFLVLESVNMSFAVKLQRVAAMLECTPTISGIGEALADRLYSVLMT